ncbi:N,N-dimethylformamidase beta subunit family domain-containing protein [Planctomicrobium sp. SH661]|uniref:N,N-dimethylformamidase beta subunit family domain-containing protein n=1 Tax=Planctomicrobium sp. SH661 TaxID=3448124 RepID=UPI003F5C5940
MLIGYVSDERFVALSDALLEFTNGRGASYEARSRASGAVHCDLPPGEYLVTIVKEGYGSKRVTLIHPSEQPFHFRLLSDCLLGYAWPKCVRSGESSEFRVHSVEPYHLELWRYGWKKELVRKLGWFDDHGPRATMQITPDGDYSQTGIRWNSIGYQNSSHRQHVTAPSQSGLYYFHASTRSGDSFTFPWVVAPEQPQSRVAVLMSDINWNAYNPFGGRSNYFNCDVLPSRPIVNSRLESKRYRSEGFQSWGANEYARLSFDRPEPINHIDPATDVSDPIAGRAACHVAAAEWRLLGWLEREKISYDLYTETQLHRKVLDLSAYSVLLLGPHPEYWTRDMYYRVKNWVFHEGGRLMYLGGNGLNCEVTLDDEHGMVVLNGAIRSLWPEGIGAESRFAKRNESEASLLGVVFTPAGIMTGAPYKVVDADHWAFRGTGLKNGELFGERSLHERCPGGASGHETDKRSVYSPAKTHLLAKGLNPGDGGAEMVHFETASGRAVFSTGSINYISSLLVDDHVSRLTANVLHRFLE